MNRLLKKFNRGFEWIKERLERINNERFKINLVQSIPFWIASLVTGLVAVGYAKLFAIAEEYSLGIAKNRGWLLFIISPLCFVLARLMVTKFAKMANGSGIPQVIVAIRYANPKQSKIVEMLLSARIIIVKAISSFILVFGGGAIGREGPTIQISGSIFWSVYKVLPKAWAHISKRNIIITGAAAGLAAAFNTPLGGIVFAVEELSKTHFNYFKTAIFTAVILSGLTAQWLAGPYLYLGYPSVDGLSPVIVGYVVIVAVICGIAGAFMSKIIIYLIDLKASFKNKYTELLIIMGSGLAVAALAYFFTPAIIGSGRAEMLRVLFSGDKSAGWQLPLVRILGPILSYTAGAAGGVFAPSLSAGAAVGAYVAELSHLAANNANLIILSGMVAFLTGVTKSPFTSAILVLEMTDRHNVIFHLMIAAIIANLMSALVDKNSFYTHLEHRIIHQLGSTESLANAASAEIDE